MYIFIYSPNTVSKYDLCVLTNNAYNLNIKINEIDDKVNINKTLTSQYDRIFEIKNIENQILELKNFNNKNEQFLSFIIPISSKILLNTYSYLYLYTSLHDMLSARNNRILSFSISFGSVGLLIKYAFLY